MKHLIDELIKSFEPSRKNRVDLQYNEFLAHIYMIHDKRMTVCRSESIRNKYIKERNSILVTSQRIRKQYKIISVNEKFLPIF